MSVEPVSQRAVTTEGSGASKIVSLRRVEPDDLQVMFQMQLDPESNRMAVTNPRSAEVFYPHWAKLLADPGVTARAVLLGGGLAGYISSFMYEGQVNVGYWITREYWGKGVATQALGLLLLEVTTRPLYAQAATSNVGSLRVLKNCGFVVERVQVSPATERFPECEVAVLVLKC